MLRFHLVSFLSIFAGSVAYAQTAPTAQAGPTPCPVGQICSPIPPGSPPTTTPALEAQERARIEQETRAQYTPEAYQKAQKDTFYARQATFLQRAEALRPPDVPLYPPYFEVGATMRGGTLDKVPGYFHAGPELSVAYRLSETFAIDLPVAFLETRDRFSRWFMFGFRPALVVSYTDHSVTVSGRIGPDALVPDGAGELVPKSFVGGEAGFVLQFVAARLGQTGYAAMVFGADFAGRAAQGGTGTSLDGVRFGFDANIGVRFGF